MRTKKQLVLILNILVFMLGFGVKSFSQDIPEPEREKRPYFLVEGELKNFEKVKAKLDIKVKGLGYGGSESFLTAFNKQSNIRYTSKKLPRIIIKLSGDEDPEDYIAIFRQTKKRKKDRRRFKQGSMSMLGKSRDVSSSEISFELKKVKEEVYEIIFDNSLVSDEYAIVPIKNLGNSLSSYNSQQTIYCFGID